jgi:hypothetical protein
MDRSTWRRAWSIASREGQSNAKAICQSPSLTLWRALQVSGARSQKGAQESIFKHAPKVYLFDPDRWGKVHVPVAHESRMYMS